MKPIREAWAGLIDVTYYCGKECVYCTRNDRHLGKMRYNMTMEQVEAALQSYKGFPGLIGIIGGEPLAYPKFEDMCEMIRRHHPRDKMHLFTSIDPSRHRYTPAINATFGHVAYHPHTKEQEDAFFHQPLTIASKDVVKDDALRNALIDDCWVQRKWCSTITDEGAFFCEVGASIAKLNRIRGWDVVPGWWERTPADFGEQKSVCEMCGMCVPMVRQKMSDKKERISPSFLKMLQDADVPIGEHEVFDKQFTIVDIEAAIKDWTPGAYKVGMEDGFPYSTIDCNKFKEGQ